MWCYDFCCFVADSVFVVLRIFIDHYIQEDICISISHTTSLPDVREGNITYRGIKLSRSTALSYMDNRKEKRSIKMSDISWDCKDLHNMSPTWQTTVVIALGA